MIAIPERARPAAEKLVAERVVPGLVILVQQGSQAPQSVCVGTDGGGKPLRGKL